MYVFVILLLSSSLSFGKSPFRDGIALKNRFINRYLCNAQEFKILRENAPVLFQDNKETYNGTCPTIAEDRLKIKPNVNSDLIVSLEMNFYNGHQCSLINETFYRKGKQFIFKKNELGSKKLNDYCTIKLVKEKNFIKFEVLNKAKESGCHVFCGARGSIDNVSFKFK